MGMETITSATLRGLIDEHPDEGVFRIHRRMFTDEAIFELEMRHIFEGGWVYVAHESPDSRTRTTSLNHPHRAAAGHPDRARSR